VRIPDLTTGAEVEPAGGKRPRRRRSARLRLTLLYTGLFVAAGAVLLGVVYGLVAHSLGNPRPPKLPDQQFLNECNSAFKFRTPLDPNSQVKCKAALKAAAALGASSQRDQTLQHLLVYGIVALAGTTVFAAVLGWFVAGRILRPVHAITAAARRASERHLGERLALGGPRDELRELADTFDDLLARLDAAFAGQRRFVANASHELRTPLTVMQTAVDVTLAKPNVTDQQLRAMGETVRGAVRNAERLIDALLTLARSDQEVRSAELVDLATCAQSVLDAADEPIVARGLRVDADLREAPVAGDAVLLERLVANLVDNAIRYNTDDGSIRITTSSDGKRASVRVANDGRVIPENRVVRLFEPFERLDGRTNADGVGLGLSIVQAVARAHHGVVEATAPPDGGLDVTVSLPASATAGPRSDRSRRVESVAEP
jgi:signal transduction histidine kinase